MIRVSVRALCEFAARTGDLDHRYTPAPTAIEGIEGHQQLVGRRSPDYQPEYRVQGACLGLDVRGRADGFDKSSALVEEIKTHRGDLARLNPGKKALHMAQLKCYGALICRQQNIEEITLCLTYYDVDNDKETSTDTRATAQSLWSYLEDLCERYGQWARQEDIHRTKRNTTLKALVFPYRDFRNGQRDLAEAVYKATSNSRAALIQAPTGSGKTVGNLFPALMAMGAKDSDRLFFLTARNTGRIAALEALERIFQTQNNHRDLRVLVYSAREQSCEHPTLACNGESCPLARGFFNRLPVARQQSIATLDQQPGDNRFQMLTPNLVRDIALANNICPYYLSQELTRWTDVIIADINYYFDQHALLYALRQQENWRVTLLIDEAHNLIDRARDMYSISLNRALLNRVRKSCPTSLKRPMESLHRAWQRTLKPLKPELSDGRTLLLDAVPDQLTSSLQRAVTAITDYLAEHGGDKNLQDLLFECMAFLNLAELFDSHSVCRLRVAGGQSENNNRGLQQARLEIQNLIPAPFLQPRFNSSDAVVLFSATLTPFNFYRDLLGLPANSLTLRVNSPFQPEQLEVRIATGISTRLEHRESSISPVVARISRQFRLKPANYLVYLSSFAYLESLRQGFEQLAPTLPLLAQHRGMDAEARQAFIDQFQEQGANIGLAVLGGAFGEGIDLPGTRLHGVFILTLGLPPHDDIHEILKDRLNLLYGNGYNYTYLYPGIQKVVQAAGRVIRTQTDTGVIELIDQRFNRAEIKALLPDWWPLPILDDCQDSNQQPPFYLVEPSSLE